VHDELPRPPSDGALAPLSAAAARAAADDYELLRSPAAAVGGRLDLVLLGLGADGHTASLFPGTDVLDESTRWVSACKAPDGATAGGSAAGAGESRWRVTLTAAFINRAALVLMLVSGAAKAAAVKEVIQGSAEYHRAPARLIRPSPGRLCWLLDEEAASALDLADSAGRGLDGTARGHVVFTGHQGAK
jgi:6-phosphogluconolactonase